MEQEISITPTVLFCDGEVDGTVDVFTVDPGGGDHLIVFRALEDAWAYQKHTGRTDLKAIGMHHRALSRLLKVRRIEFVALPEHWPGEGTVDSYTAKDFIQMLEESAQY